MQPVTSSMLAPTSRAPRYHEVGRPVEDPSGPDPKRGRSSFRCDVNAPPAPDLPVKKEDFRDAERKGRTLSIRCDPNVLHVPDLRSTSEAEACFAARPRAQPFRYLAARLRAQPIRRPPAIPRPAPPLPWGPPNATTPPWMPTPRARSQTTTAIPRAPPNSVASPWTSRPRPWSQSSAASRRRRRPRCRRTGRRRKRTSSTRPRRKARRNARRGVWRRSAERRRRSPSAAACLGAPATRPRSNGCLQVRGR
mmetsp:Transcript_2537/g.6349  ORF Transcript_2537/g.6349 Transcript_2537/m.6349 type:complete len:251 (-) Transcript_2537:270-1022(-)